MKAEFAALAVGEEVPQGHGDCAEGNFFPGNVGLGEQRNVEAFLARGEVEVKQARTVNNVYLVDVRHRDHRVGSIKRDARAGFLMGFAQGRLGNALLVFHETSRQRPAAVARLDGAPAEQNLVFPDRQGADDQTRISVVDGAALVANVTRNAVARGNAHIDGAGADAAEVDGGIHALILNCALLRDVRSIEFAKNNSGRIRNARKFRQCLVRSSATRGD